MLAAVLCLACSGCATSADREFPAGAAFDYQLGGASPPPRGVEAVVRDRTDEPAPDLFNVCYINAFQTQPGEFGEWPDVAVLRAGGEPVLDPDWPDEALLDISTGAGRDVVIERVSGWIRDCADDGFDAVELDNLDSFTRSGGALRREDAVEAAAALVDAAHEAGLMAAQKNAAEYAGVFRDEAGFDFAVSEECAAFDECGAYTRAYGDSVMAIEYTDEMPRAFAAVCADPETPAATILRDRALGVPGDRGYTYDIC